MSGSGSPQRPLIFGGTAPAGVGNPTLPPAPTPFGAYVPAVQTGNLLFLSGMLPTLRHEPRVLGCLGKDVDVDSARNAPESPRSMRSRLPGSIWALSTGYAV
jgi:hypothetical protein